MIFLTSPVLLYLPLTEYESVYIPLSLVLGSVFCFVRYLHGKSTLFLMAAAMLVGMTTLTRLEVVVWVVVSSLFYLIWVQPRAVIQRWRQTRQKSFVILGVVAGFCVGAAPTLVYNIVCPSDNLISFLLGRALPRSLDSAAMPLSSRVLVRIEQFWSHSLLQQWPMFELRTPNTIFALFWVLSALSLIWQFIRRKCSSLPLIIILVVLPLSLVTSGSLRHEHLTVLQPAVILVLIAGLISLMHYLRLQSLMYMVFTFLVIMNIIVAVDDWQRWQSQPRTMQTMLNQSDPALLFEYLRLHHANDRILYTNIGMPQYMQYISKGIMKGEDIMDWSGIDGFSNAVKLSLLDATKRRVFVAVAPERDGAVGTLPRTKRLYRILDEHKIPYSVTQLASERNAFLYHIVVVDQGITFSPDAMQGRSILIDDVRDVRALENSTSIVGSVHGSGFRPGDVVLVNGSPAATAFGNEGWITFSTGRAAIGGSHVFSVEVFRPSTLERSQAVSATLGR